MGEEIAPSDYTKDHFREFDRRLKRETDLLELWYRNGSMAQQGYSGGYELEAWMVDDAFEPVPRNDEFLQKLDNPLVVPELSKFNLEFNGPPVDLVGGALSKMQSDLDTLWDEAGRVAGDMGVKLMRIGILPTINEDDMVEANMSKSQRYKAVNAQIFKLRKGKPIELKFEHNDGLHSIHQDVMMEAATTSFQVHLKIGARSGAAFYNASKMASGPLVGIAANSPFLFGKNLWAETRIPLFERAVSVGKWDYAERVTFGVRYLEESLMEAFFSNRRRYPVLLPTLFDDSIEEMRHVRLHNGTIWRWNRPILGYDADGTPHFRIEQRVLPAGPTSADEIANAAFYYGLVQKFIRQMPDLLWDMPFAQARDNFYTSARDGMDADVEWCNGRIGSLRELVSTRLLPWAREGLELLALDKADIDHYLGIIAARVERGQNGATWQRDFYKASGANMNELCAAYYEHQQSGIPVHEWPNPARRG